MYGNGWDNIFKKKGKAQEPPPPSPSAAAAVATTATASWPPARPAVPDPQQQQLSAKLEALDAALGMGALSPALYEQARRELA